MPIPQVVPRSYSLIIEGDPPAGPTFGPFGDNKLVGNFEFVKSEIGQVGTQYDGLGHIGIQTGEPGDTDEMRYYNGFSQTEIYGANGLQKLGIEEINPIFTQGILIDVAGIKGRMLQAGEEITLKDVEKALKRQKMKERTSSRGMRSRSTPAGAAFGWWTTAKPTAAIRGSAWRLLSGSSSSKSRWSAPAPGRWRSFPTQTRIWLSRCIAS